MKPGYIHIIYKIHIYIYYIYIYAELGWALIFFFFFSSFFFLSFVFLLKGAHESTGRRLQSGVPLGALVGEEGERGGQEDDVSEGGVRYVYIYMTSIFCCCQTKKTFAHWCATDVYIRMYICMCVCVCVCIFIYLYLYIGKYILYIYVNTYIYLYVYIYD